MLIGSVTEEGMRFLSNPTEQEWRQTLAESLGDEKATALIGAMKKAHPEKAIRTLSYGAQGLSNRNNVQHMAQLKYEQHQAPVYAYLFNTAALASPRRSQDPGGLRQRVSNGSCVTLLFEVTYLDTPGSRAVFSPISRGNFDDGRVAASDDTGVGCDVRGMRALGYESGPRRNFKKDETARVFIGAIHVPAADEGRLAYATVYGDDRTRMAVEIVHTP